MESLLKWYIKTYKSRKQSLSIHQDDYEFWDHGGMPRQINKWVNSFENISAVIYVVSLDDYNKKCQYYPYINAMTYSIQKFSQLINLQMFCTCIRDGFWRRSIFFIIFNKKDLFRKQLKLWYNFNASFHDKHKWNPKYNYYTSYIFS